MSVILLAEARARLRQAPAEPTFLFRRSLGWWARELTALASICAAAGLLLIWILPQ